MPLQKSGFQPPVIPKENPIINIVANQSCVQKTNSWVCETYNEKEVNHTNINRLFSHGGVLDRVDSHFFAAWFAFSIFAYFLI